MKNHLDINKVYTDLDGDNFAHVLLDNRQGIEQPNGSYQTSTSDDEVNTLGSDQFSRIQSACSTGDEFLAQGDREAIINAFKAYAGALGELPEPTNSWHASGWILSRMGECYFRLGSFKQAKGLYGDLMWHPGAIGNPWIHLRHGEVCFEMEEMGQAGNELMRAYMGGGKEIFALEDPKYYAYLKTIANGLE